MKILEIAYHRNGTVGNGFHAVRFTEGRGKDKTDFLAVVFDEPGNVAVIATDFLAPFGVGNGNKWRGDDEWGKQLRKAIAKWEVETHGQEPK